MVVILSLPIGFHLWVLVLLPTVSCIAWMLALSLIFIQGLKPIYPRNFGFWHYTVFSVLIGSVLPWQKYWFAWSCMQDRKVPSSGVNSVHLFCLMKCLARRIQERLGTGPEPAILSIRYCMSDTVVEICKHLDALAKVLSCIIWF